LSEVRSNSRWIGTSVAAVLVGWLLVLPAATSAPDYTNEPSFIHAAPPRLVAGVDALLVVHVHWASEFCSGDDVRMKYWTGVDEPPYPRWARPVLQAGYYTCHRVAVFQVPGAYVEPSVFSYVFTADLGGASDVCPWVLCLSGNVRGESERYQVPVGLSAR